MEVDTTDWVQRSFRFESSLDEWLISRAKLNLRSINSEVTHILMKERDSEATG